MRAGVPFRKKVEPVAAGRYHLVQIKDVDKDHGLRIDSLVRVDAPEASQSHLLRKGDVLFVARGTRNDAVVFASEMKDAIAGAQFFVIRPTSRVLPEYLAWYLNQESAQKHIAEYSSGSFVPFVPKAALEEVEVLLPPIEDQRRMVAIQELSVKEQELLNAIKAKRRELVEAALGRRLAEIRFTEHIVKKHP
jgi:restriction endonuclease S subunit